jgi:hypothetical protein
MFSCEEKNNYVFRQNFTQFSLELCFEKVQKSNSGNTHGKSYVIFVTVMRSEFSLKYESLRGGQILVRLGLNSVPTRHEVV